MDCRKCGKSLGETNVIVNGVTEDSVDLIIECQECGHRINTFAHEDDFMDLDALQWVRDDQSTFTALMLVSGHDVPREAINAWSDDECRQAEAWAFAVHLRASDNDDVEVPPMPACVAAYPET